MGFALTYKILFGTGTLPIDSALYTTGWLFSSQKGCLMRKFDKHFLIVEVCSDLYQEFIFTAETVTGTILTVGASKSLWVAFIK